MTNNAIAKQRNSEEELVRRIHRAVGGPSKLSTYDDPAAVRQVVILALAAEQSDTTEGERITKGDLTVFERRVVRTVTNRGAAVRSRMRQRKELARLRDELRRKDLRLKQLEAALHSITSNFSIHVPVPLSPVSPCIPDSGASSSSSDIPHIDLNIPAATSTPTATDAVDTSATANANTLPFTDVAGMGIDTGANGESVDRVLFGTLVDQLIEPL